MPLQIRLIQKNSFFYLLQEKVHKKLVDRACAKFNLDQKYFPHFRTLHSLAFKWTGMKSEDVIKSADMRFIGKKTRYIF